MDENINLINDEEELKLFKEFLDKKNNNMPKIFYKYRELNNKKNIDRTLNLLQNDGMWFSNYINYCDKEEGNIINKGTLLLIILHSMKQNGFFNNENIKKYKNITGKPEFKEMVDILMGTVRNKDYFKKEKLEEHEIEDVFNTFVHETLDIVLEYGKKYIDEFKKHNFSTCLCETSESDEMWNNYGDNHKGICIGYEIDSNTILNESHIYPISYCSLPLSHHKLTYAYYIRILTRKNEEFEGEREWRVIPFYHDPFEELLGFEEGNNTPYCLGGCYYKFPKPLIVILGKNMHEAMKNKIIKICEERKIKYKIDSNNLSNNIVG